jgi:hypothetical protein
MRVEVFEFFEHRRHASWLTSRCGALDRQNDYPLWGSVPWQIVSENGSKK